MAVGFAALVIAIMKLFPDHPSVKWLSYWLVERPVKWFASARRHHIIFAVIIIGLLLAPETLMMLGAVDLSLVTFALDVSFYIDAVAAMALVGAFTYVVKGWHIVRVLVTRQQRSAILRRRGRRASLSRKLPANDDEDSSYDPLAA